jgi:hypothetical protein
MMNLIASQTKSILVSLDKFLNKEGDETLFKGITTYMENLNLETNKYFSNVFDILTKSLIRGLYIQLPTEKGNDSTQNSSFSFTIGNDSNVSIINVNI